MQSSKPLLLSVFVQAAILLLLPPQAQANDCSLESLADSAKGSRKLLHGHYLSSFEHSGFTPCPTKIAAEANPTENTPASETWWTGFRQPDLFRAMQQELKKLGGSKYKTPEKSLFLRIEACVSEPGSYGHMGAYPRYIEIIKVLDFRPQEDEDCIDAGSSRKIKR